MRKTILAYTTAVDSLESALELGNAEQIADARDKMRIAGQVMETDICRTEGDEIFGQVDFYSLLQVAGYEELTERANQTLRDIANAQPYWVSTTYAPLPKRRGFFAQVKKNLFLKKRLTQAEKFLLKKVR